MTWLRKVPSTYTCTCIGPACTGSMPQPPMVNEPVPGVIESTAPNGRFDSGPPWGSNAVMPRRRGPWIVQVSAPMQDASG